MSLYITLLLSLRAIVSFIMIMMMICFVLLCRLWRLSSMFQYNRVPQFTTSMWWH